MASDSIKARSKILAPVAFVYGKRMVECGASPEGVYWSSVEGQTLRFEVLLDIIAAKDAAQGGITINDLGCGYGALFDRIEDDPLFIDGRYYGYDVCADMVSEANKRHHDRRAEFIQSAAATRKADYSLVSGTYNMRVNTPMIEWRNYVFESLRDLWDRTDKGLAFNMLSGTGADHPGGLYYADHQEYFAFCSTVLSPNIELRQNYGLKEWTMFIRR